MKLASWNVNGIRAVVKKDFDQSLAQLGADVLGLQETKAQDDQVREALFGLDGYEAHSSSAVKKGYSGTAILTKETPIKVQAGIGVSSLDQEGRVLHAEFNDSTCIWCTRPTRLSGLKRLPFRNEWNAAFESYLKELDADKPVVCCGDLNVAHQHGFGPSGRELQQNPGVHPDEIDGMTSLLGCGFHDTWREANPDTVSHVVGSLTEVAPGENVGWRLDYMLVSSGRFLRCQPQRSTNDPRIRHFNAQFSLLLRP